MTTATGPNPAQHCANDDAPAAVVLVYLSQGSILGQVLCEACATCTDTRCGELGAILDSDYEEPWCAEHRDAWAAGGEPVHGPDIVPIGSARHLEALAEQSGGSW